MQRGNTGLILGIALVLVISDALGRFNSRDAGCITNIMFQRLKGLLYVPGGGYLMNVRKIVDDADQVTFSDIFDSRISSDIDLLLNYSDSLNNELKRDLENCKLNLANTLARCEERYGKDRCEPLNSFSFQQKCPDEHFNVKYKSFYCYKKCPEGFEERGNRCLKPPIRMLKPYATRKECLQQKYVLLPGCSQYHEGIWVPDCPPFYKKQLKFYCVPYCPAGWIEDKTSCVKTGRRETGVPVVFNFIDLILVNSERSTERTNNFDFDTPFRNIDTD